MTELEKTYKELLTDSEYKKMKRLQFEAGEHFKDSFWRFKPEEAEKYISLSKPLIDYSGTKKQQEQIKEMADEQNALHKKLTNING